MTGIAFSPFRRSWLPTPARKLQLCSGFRAATAPRTVFEYNLLAQAGLNLALEFIYGGPHTLLSHHHVPVVSNATGSHPDPQ